MPTPTPEGAEALERLRPGPMALPDYARWLKGLLEWSGGKRESVPRRAGRVRFTLPPDET
jgi:hypothetical protein